MLNGGDISFELNTEADLDSPIVPKADVVQGWARLSSIWYSGDYRIYGRVTHLQAPESEGFTTPTGQVVSKTMSLQACVKWHGASGYVELHEQ